LIGHISTDELASYHAGAIAGVRGSQISAHLANCPSCAGVESQLGQVSALLASVPVPAMPEALTQRLRNALAVEAATRAARHAAAGARPVRRERHWRHRVPGWSSPVLLRSLAAVGAIAVVVGGGVFLANLGSSGSPSIAARQANPARTKQRYTTMTPNTSQPVASVLPVSYRSAGHVFKTTVVVSDLSYTKADLAGGVRQRISSPLTVPGYVRSGGFSTPATQPGSAAEAVSPRRLAGCFSKVAAGREIFQAEVARYRGLPATIVILRPVGNIFDVIVVGAACSAADADVITRLSLSGS
jgi:hypothetical protein